MAHNDRKRARRGSSGRREWGPVLPLVLLALSLGVTALLAVEAYQAQRSQRATAEALLRDYGVFAARSTYQAWLPRVNQAVRATLSQAHGAAMREATTQQCLQTLLLEDAALQEQEEDCDCTRSLVGDGAWAFHIAVNEESSEGLYAGALPDEDARESIARQAIQFARAGMPRGSGQFLQWFDPGAGADPVLVAFAGVRTYTADTAVYGVQIDPARLRSTFEATLRENRLLPEALLRGADAHDLLAIDLRTPHASTLMATRPEASMDLAGIEPIHTALGGGTVRAAVLPEAASMLVIGGLPGDRVPLLMLLLGLSAGLATLAVRQLRRENELARLRSDFVASVSHELRTPLAQVRLFVETLRLGRTRTPAEQEWALGAIDRETHRLTGLVENILHFARAERRQHGGELEDVRLSPLVHEVVRGFAPLAAPQEVEFNIELPEGVGIHAHRAEFRQVLLNLLDNAVKYGPRGQTVRVGGAARGGWVEFWVEDEGPGIPEEERAAVFEPFRRGQRTIGGFATGSGIGLSVVRGIVDRWGGAVRADAAVSGGARVVVSVPNAKAQRPEGPTPDVRPPSDVSVDAPRGVA